MHAAPIPANDAERLASLERMKLLSTPREADLDRVTRIAQKIFETEISLVSLVDKDRQWFKSRVGLNATETPRDISFCGHAINGEEAFVVTNAIEDERFHDNPLVTGDPRIRFYAGQPIANAEGYNLGTLCVISPQPREFSEEDEQILSDLGRMVEIVLDNREMSETISAMFDSVKAPERDKLIDPLTGLCNVGGLSHILKPEISRCAREKNPLAVAVVEIDGLAEIKNELGESAVSEAIELAASLLVDGSRASDIVARYYDEKFVLIAPGVVPAMLPTIGDKILRVFRTRAKLNTNDGYRAFTCSVGLAVDYPKKKSENFATEIMEKANSALALAQLTGPGHFEIQGASGKLYENVALA